MMPNLRTLQQFLPVSTVFKIANQPENTVIHFLLIPAALMLTNQFVNTVLQFLPVPTVFKTANQPENIVIQFLPIPIAFKLTSQFVNTILQFLPVPMVFKVTALLGRARCWSLSRSTAALIGRGFLARISSMVYKLPCRMSVAL